MKLRIIARAAEKLRRILGDEPAGEVEVYVLEGTFERGGGAKSLRRGKVYEATSLGVHTDGGGAIFVIFDPARTASPEVGETSAAKANVADFRLHRFAKLFREDE